MGNNPSKSASRSCTINSSDSISKPKALYASHDDDMDSGGGVHRSATARASSGDSKHLGVPSTAHRRSRSALASTSRAPNRESVPPPYSVAVADTAGLFSSQTLAVPPSNGHAHARRSSWNSGAVAPAQAPSVQRQSGIPPAGVPPVTAAERAEALRRPMRQNSVEDALDTLTKYNTIIVVDDSGSMQGARWREARDALAALADIAARYDADGIDICFLNSKNVGNNMKDSTLIRRLFDTVRPNGTTPIGEKLESLLLYYLDNLEHAKSLYDAGNQAPLKAIKPANYIVITDGAPTDDPESVIVAAARRLDTHNFPLSQVGIQFVQIGNSPDATAFLDELDNGLAQTYNIRDIVDTTPYTGGSLSAEIIIKILLGGINRRVDRRGGQSVV